MAPGSPVPDAVAAELRRVAERWQQLPLGHALSLAPAVRGLAQDLADAVAAAEHRAVVPLPDLGPATAYDQLVVTSYDACAAGLAPDLPVRLQQLRAALARPPG